MNEKIKIFTDGSCLGNPGPGGCGIVLYYKKYKKEYSVGYKLTTSNRMELMAAIVALEVLKYPCEIIINTDSKYLYQGISFWIYNWKKSNWKNTKKELVKNADLWQRLDMVIQPHILEWNWIKGHAGHPENEYCDKLAKNAANNPILDDIY